MNKYEEALEFLIDKADDLCQSLTSKIILSKKADVLQELVEKEEKYKWHDLRKNPNDLPTKDQYVLAIFKDENRPSIVDCLNGKFGEYTYFTHYELEGYPVEEIFEFYDEDDYEVVAWRYIEEFKDE